MATVTRVSGSYFWSHITPFTSATLDWSFESLPAPQQVNTKLVIDGVSVILTTSAVAGNRRLTFQWRTAGGDIIMSRIVLATQAASLTVRYELPAEKGTQSATTANICLDCLNAAVFLVDSTEFIRFGINNFQAGDGMTDVVVRGRILAPTD